MSTRENNPPITAVEFIGWVLPEVFEEAHFTETCNEDRTLGDYVADLATYLQRCLDGEVETVNLAREGRMIAVTRRAKQIRGERRTDRSGDNLPHLAP